MNNTVTRRPQGQPTAKLPRPITDRTDAASLYTAAGRRKYLNADERRRVLDSIDDLPRVQGLFVLTLSWSGARVSEVLALRPDAFQLDQGVVSIRTLKRRCHSVREVPLPPELMAALNEAFAIGPLQRDADTAQKLLWPWHRVTAWRVVKRVMQTAEGGGTPASPRGLRHAFGVGTLQAGIPITLVQRWLGHARLTTTAIYAAVTGPEEIAFARKFWRPGT